MQKPIPAQRPSERVAAAYQILRLGEVDQAIAKANLAISKRLTPKKPARGHA